MRKRRTVRRPWAVSLATAALVVAASCQTSEQESAVEGDAAGRVADTATSETASADAAAPATGGGGFRLAEVGFQGPESVLHDTAADIYLVSNINGDPFAKDDNGFISRISPEGRLLELKWIDGASEDVTLHAPKGLAVHGDTLFAADIDSVRAFRRDTGAPLGARGIPGVSFLNDLATGPDGTLYVTDTGLREGMQPSGTDALYRFGPDGQAEVVVKGPELDRPNGVAVDAQGPVVVTFGSGKILRVGADGALSPMVAPPTGQLDGVVLLGEGGMIVTSWEGKAVYHITTTGEVHKIWEDIESAADLGFDASRSRMLVPTLMGNTVEVQPTH